MLKRTTRKVKVAILFGYSGTGYSGMQIQPDVNTIEKELLKALYEAKLVSESNKMDVNKVNFMRCARTDKGVHALGQVINLKLEMESDDLNEAKRRLNLCLPDQIRIWDILKTTKAFHAKDLCSSRHYSYWMPTYIFENKPGPNDAYRMTEDQLTKIQSILDMYKGSHKFHNFTVKVSGSSDKARRNMMDLKVENPIICNYPINIDNRTSGEWIKIHIHGQSFMLHQIRKMMSLIIFILRYNLDSDKIVAYLMDPTTKQSIPKAPALGLLLYYPEFEFYHLKLENLKATNSAFEMKEKVDLKVHVDEMTEFFHNRIFPSMLQEEIDGIDRFTKWIEQLESEKDYLEPFKQFVK